MLKHSVHYHPLKFIRPGGTSRGVLKQKDSWFLSVWHTETPHVIGIGECSIIKGLSPDPLHKIHATLQSLTWAEGGLSPESINHIQAFPAIQFAVETALIDLHNGGRRILYETDFIRGKTGVKINGLIWMGDANFMKQQLRQKLDLGYRCVKLKIGALDFDSEIALLHEIRKSYSADDIEIRVDANGAFDPSSALEKLKRLSEFNLHSIEQPIKPGNWEFMSELCSKTPLDIALDEELINVGPGQHDDMLNTILPQYIILKPSLLGGLKQSRNWIDLANKHSIGWWTTSALESNIGLNAIAQWTTTLDTNMYQGLGTGRLFSNNISAPLYLDKDILMYDPLGNWGNIPKSSI